jgi:hypothetical protein
MSSRTQTVLRVVSTISCTAVYFAGIGYLIAVSADVPMGAITDVGASLWAYGGTAVLCLIAMCVYARCIPVANDAGEVSE